ncbi:MAG: sulfatase-like hydrolase/transferase [Spirochaetia bacterium]|nr:sulfatase-like hydrolase/transferase [Spirochaetia bacterium]
MAHGVAASRPRGIILILADDLGVGDVSCLQGKDFLTPNIDSLAREGVLFTDGYASAPVCMPSRCGLLTGRPPAAFGVQTNPNEDGTETKDQGLPVSEKTLAQHLQSAGYRTALIGKWHLGETPAQHPLRRGFDEFFGFLGGHTDYTHSGELLRGKTPVSESGYLTEVLTREALAFLDRNKFGNFFLCLTYNAVHSPMQASDAYLSQVPKEITDPGRRIAAAMTLALDAGVGAVAEKLGSLGLDRDTLVVFTSDNGAKIKFKTSNGALRGEKGTLYEGGIRVPFFMKYPSAWPSGMKISFPVSSLDFHPTLMALVGNELPTESAAGVNLAPHLSGAAPDRAIYWKWGPSSGAVRKGKWKYFKTWNDSALFDLETDPAEKINRAETEPQTTAELKTLLQVWEKSLPPPLWGPPQWFKKPG